MKEIKAIKKSNQNPVCKGINTLSCSQILRQDVSVARSIKTKS